MQAQEERQGISVMESLLTLISLFSWIISDTQPIKQDNTNKQPLAMFFLD